MGVTWIIEVLRALANRLWPGPRRSTSPGRSTATVPLFGSSHAATDEPGTDPEQPTPDDIPGGNLGHDDGTSQEQADSGDTEDENGTTESADSTPGSPSVSGPSEQVSPDSRSDSADQPPSASTGVDSESPVAETGGHSERDDPGRINYGSGSTEKPPKLDCKPREIGACATEDAGVRSDVSLPVQPLRRARVTKTGNRLPNSRRSSSERPSRHGLSSSENRFRLTTTGRRGASMHFSAPLRAPSSFIGTASMP